MNLEVICLPSVLTKIDNNICNINPVHAFEAGWLSHHCCTTLAVNTPVVVDNLFEVQVLRTILAMFGPCHFTCNHSI